MNGYSLSAVDRTEQVVGFQLVKEELWFEQRRLRLAYAAVSPAAANCGVFRRFIELEKQHGSPLVAEVKPDNRSRTGAILARYGFEQFGTEFVWNP